MIIFVIQTTKWIGFLEFFIIMKRSNLVIRLLSIVIFNYNNIVLMHVITEVLIFIAIGN